MPTQRSLVLLLLLLGTIVTKADESIPEERVSAAIQARIAEWRGVLKVKSASLEREAKAKERSEEVLNVEALIAIVKRARVDNDTLLYREAVSTLGHYSDNPSVLRFFVDQLDDGEVAAPRFTQRPLEHFAAAAVLAKCGSKARYHILEAVTLPQSERRLHIMAYVFAQTDQDERQPFDVEIPVLRLRRVLERIQRLPERQQELQFTTAKNVQRMIAIMQAPQFSVNDFPSE